MRAEWKEASGSSAKITRVAMTTAAPQRSHSRWRKSEKRRSSSRVDGLPSPGPTKRAKACASSETHAPPVRRMATPLRRVMSSPSSK